MNGDEFDGDDNASVGPPAQGNQHMPADATLGILANEVAKYEEDRQAEDDGTTTVTLRSLEIVSKLVFHRPQARGI